ncbi:hypothetical protein P9272_32720 [Mesorhizobium sp. WSM4976]|nr:hypothetical protein [Mesorhizobium sp. WSM4976]MDG4898299.1 hypothetical protein [Mesorhizobium sp. WSM4976]
MMTPAQQATRLRQSVPGTSAVQDSGGLLIPRQHHAGLNLPAPTF